MNKLIGVMLIALLFTSYASANDGAAVDFGKMRMDYAKRTDFDPSWELSEAREKIMDMWDNKKVDEGMKLAKKWLKKHPFDADMHTWYAYFLKQKGDFQGYFRHMYFYRGLLASITSSGTGLTSKSPMKVISVTEEYSVLTALGAKVIEQSLITSKAGIECDQLECEMNGKKITLYFDVTIPMDYTSKMLSSKTEKKKASSNKETDKKKTLSNKVMDSAKK